MSSQIIFIHNRPMDYRIPLFRILKDVFKDDLEVWHYHQTKEDRKEDCPGRYFSHFEVKIRLLSRRFYRPVSLSSVWALARERESKIIILSGVNASYELPLFFLIAKFKQKKLIFWTETWNWGKKHWEVNSFSKLNGLIAQCADRVLYPGQKVKEVYDALNIPASKQIFIPNASRNSDYMDEDYINNFIRPTPGRIHVVYLARIVPRKGLNYLIEAMKLLPSPSSYELLVGGSGDTEFENRCRGLARRNPNIRFCGPVRKEKVNSLLHIADVYVYPSVNLVGLAEPWGLALNEAVALGKPCVATDMVAAAYDLIEEGKNGFMVREKDPQALAAAIAKAAMLPKDVVFETCKKKNKVYTHENMAKGFIEAINQIR